MRHLMDASVRLLAIAAIISCSVDETVRPRALVEAPAFLTSTTASNSVISFVSDQDGDPDIYTIRPDGTGLVNVSNNRVEDRNIVWSPDRTRIAYASDPDGTGDLEVMTMLADGTGRSRLTNKPGFDVPFSWSPVGVPVIVWVRYDAMAGGIFSGDIYGITPDGANLLYLALTSADENYPKYSPDGTLIAFVRDERDLIVMHRDGTNQMVLPTGGTAGALGNFEWSPDSRRIAFRRENPLAAHTLEICVINADGSGLVNLTNSPDNESAPHWSPDGSKIMFERSPKTTPDIWVMDADGNNQVNLTNARFGSASGATWSPDGSQIALVQSDGSGTRILVMNSDGSGAGRITQASAHYTNLSWVALPPPPPGSTPPGSDVTVSPIDQTTGTDSPIDLVFQTVTGSGTTTVTSGTVGGGGGPPPPSNFRLGNPPTYYDITTTASFDGSITVCITYTGIRYGNESNLKLLHQETQPNGSVQWVDRTTSLDTQADVICGSVTSLSPFLAAEENVAPVVSRIALPASPIPLGAVASLSADFSDANLGDTHTATIDWEGATTAGVVTEAGGSGTVTGSNTYAVPGVYTVNVSVNDGDLSGTRSSAGDAPAYIVVYDPSAGFVTGGGWINSPTAACQLTSVCGAATGKATFGFVAKYKKGATTPSGDTEFQFSAGGLRFQSSNYEWLTVAGSRAKYKGSGQINGAGNYGFLITAIDGDLNGGGSDQFRIKITDSATGIVVYDNKRGESEDSDAATPIGGGSIVIHK